MEIMIFAAAVANYQFTRLRAVEHLQAPLRTFGPCRTLFLLPAWRKK